MSDSGYTPSMEEIREYVIVGDPKPWEAPSGEVDARERRRGEAFDRAIAAHDAVIREDERKLQAERDAVIALRTTGTRQIEVRRPALVMTDSSHHIAAAIRGQSFTGTESE